MKSYPNLGLCTLLYCIVVQTAEQEALLEDVVSFNVTKFSVMFEQGKT